MASFKSALQSVWSFVSLKEPPTIKTYTVTVFDVVNKGAVYGQFKAVALQKEMYRRAIAEIERLYPCMKINPMKPRYEVFIDV